MITSAQPSDVVFFFVFKIVMEDYRYAWFNVRRQSHYSVFSKRLYRLSKFKSIHPCENRVVGYLCYNLDEVLRIKHDGVKLACQLLFKKN